MSDDERPWVILVTRRDKLGADIKVVSVDDPKKRGQPVLETADPKKYRRFATEDEACAFKHRMAPADLRHYTVDRL